MPSIIPTPPSPGISANVPTTTTIGVGHVVPAGQKLYATATGVMFNGGYSAPYASLTNNASLWIMTPGGGTPQNASILNLYYVGSITNNGLALAQSANGSAQTFFIGASMAGFTNTGQVYAIAPSAGAYGEMDWSGWPSTVTNSGLIAAQGLGATGVFRYNGGQVINTASGSILAEGGTATGVYLGRGHNAPPGVTYGADLNNAGTIKAVSTNPSNASVGVYIVNYQGELMQVVNTGVITGDFAIYTDDYAGSPPTKGEQTIQNGAGGIINGEIYLGMGNDLLINAGQIIGYVDMGDGADTVDDTAGAINGTVDLEAGDDLFQGGATAEAAIGGRGGDTLYGGGGADLLLGGRGDDFLIGGAGNDGLYGEGGVDRLTTAGGDHVDAGAGDDTVVLGDYQFADVNGGDGRDVLVLASVAKVLDLTAALATGRIHNFEAIDLPGAQELVIRQGDVSALGAGTSLSVTTTAAGKVDLVGAWVAQAPVSVGGALYTPYLLNGVTVMVAGAGLVAVVGSAPGAASGLDAVAAGAAAPLPGSTPGAVLTPSVTETTLFDLTSSLVIDADEHWLTNGSIALITSNEPKADLVNHGQLTATGGAAGARVIAGMTFGAITNTGLISGAATGDPNSLAFNIDHFNTYGVERAAATFNDATYGLYQGGSSGPLLNTGQISASSVTSAAVAYNNWTMNARNEGQISGVSTDFVAFGVYAHNGGNLTNTGDITADGKIGAYAVGASTWPLNLINSGHITAAVHTAGKQSVAIDLYYQSNTSTIANTGTITGDIAIRTFMMVNGGGLILDNGGQINGLIQLNLGVNGLVGRQDLIVNHGSISGDVTLGGERDIYVGAGGTQAGIIFGEDGDDILTGGGAADRLNGGVGDDALRGAGGADTLTGGAGKDVFLYGAASDSTAAAFDTITDFETGADRIDLTALMATGPVALDFAGGVTTLTATAAGGGQLVIHVNGAVAQGDLILASQAVTAGSAAADLLVAGTAGATLTGLAGDDLLVGSAAADRLEGGEGADLMAGGAGDDVYVVDEQDFVTELAGEGVDTIEGRVSFGGAYYVIPDNVENLVMITGYSAVGNALNNIITGNTQANFLRAVGGIDTLIGGAGNDTYYVDNAGDIIVENPGEGTELVSASTSFTLGANLENLTLEGGAGSGAGTGNAQANVITGNDFANTLSGAGGDDTLYAGRGGDSLYGGDGADLAFGDLGDDIVSGDAGADALYGDVGADTLYGGAGNDTVKGASALYFDMIGGTWRMTMTDDNAADTLYGGAGDDLLDGAGGNDTLYGGAGHDTAVYAVKAADAQWTHNANGSWTVTAGADGTDTLWGVETIQFTDDYFTIGHNADVASDFNADGKSEVLWRNDNGELYVWNSQAGQGAFLGQTLGNPGLTWQIQAVGDYDADGKADVLWRNTTGDLYVYRSDDGGAVSFTGQSISYVDPVWQVVPAAGDFNGDGRADILYRNGATGEAYLWTSNTGADVSFSGQSLGVVGSNWHIQAVDDFTGDGRADVLWRSDAGDVYLWLAFAPSGTVSINGQSVASVGNDWSILGTGDFNGDGRADVLWRHAGDGELYVWNSQLGNDVNFLGQSLGAVSLDWSVASIGDYDGDGRADVLFRNADGRVYLWNSNDTGPVGFQGQGLGQTATDWHILSDFHGM